MVDLLSCAQGPCAGLGRAGGKCGGGLLAALMGSKAQCGESNEDERPPEGGTLNEAAEKGGGPDHGVFPLR